MIGGVILAGLFLATCVWMAASEGVPGWGRTAVRYAVVIPVLFGALFLVVWAWEGLSKT